MPARRLAQLNRDIASPTVQGVTAVTGSIASDDDNGPGDNKIYLAVVVLVQAETASQAEAYAMARPLVDAVLAAIPQRGSFPDGEADCLECDVAEASADGV